MFGGPGVQLSSSLFPFQSYLNFARMRYAIIRPDQFDFSFHGPDRPKILGIQKNNNNRCGNAWPNCSRSWLQPALTSMFSSHYQAQNYCEAKHSWKETFGEVICKLNPKSVESRVNINETYFFFFFNFLPTYRLIFWQN